MSEKQQSKYNCPKCNKIFSTNSKLNRHLNKKFPCDKDPRQCIHCGGVFYDSSTKNRHENDSCKNRPKPQESDISTSESTSLES